MHIRQTLCSCLLLASISLAGHADTIEVVTEDSLYAYQRDDRVVGPGIRIAEETLRSAQLTDYSLSLYPWARAYEKALHEPNVLIFPLDRTPARETLFKWVGEIHRVASRLYKLRDNRDITVSSLEQAKQYSIGVVRNDAKQIYLQQRGFTRLVISANNHDNFQKLLNRQIQLLPMPENTARLMSKDAQVDFASLEEVYILDEQPHRVHLAFSLSTPDEVVAKAQRAFEELKASGEVARIMSEQR
ncbi:MULTISPECIES: ABC transporter substrate-binding protein [unclassified Pseudomonas]|uniref:substrate-binding periplasmic protein n=1 Tax=unclassified Pseudomonas TaxID=196821 RepID=UPI000871454E|nr:MULTISPECIES: transporter substrate-binding domain-containing protein [unclassified Pseudomonas]SCW67084.1 polar amino acid transport system substrate-binding protein [Pseudomonas sp. NFACC56-3]SFK32345.1 polar amino acid transport system substrate-binding protein [Pseudomonas sp. NFACC52]